DDCVLVRLYLPPDHPDLVATQASLSNSTSSSANKPTTSPPNPTSTPTHNVTHGTIQDIMIGVHTATITEAMRFCEHLGVDKTLMYDIVSNAAGNSKVFENYFRGMGMEGWSVEGIEEADVIVGRLEKAIQDVYSLRYPLYLGSAALQEFDRQKHEEGT
ncbi:MAG: hypothetical protein Q9205_005486, partial [Flavoplaca limonia]